MGKKIFLILFVFSFLISLVFGLQKQKQQIPPERHEVEIRLILVDVIVTKDGKFVRDLNKDDFELYEDGKKIPINSLELMSFEERALKVTKEEKEIKNHRSFNNRHHLYQRRSWTKIYPSHKRRDPRYASFRLSRHRRKCQNI